MNKIDEDIDYMQEIIEGKRCIKCKDNVENSWNGRLYATVHRRRTSSYFIAIDEALDKCPLVCYSCLNGSTISEMFPWDHTWT